VLVALAAEHAGGQRQGHQRRKQGQPASDCRQRAPGTPKQQGCEPVAKMSAPRSIAACRASGVKATACPPPSPPLLPPPPPPPSAPALERPDCIKEGCAIAEALLVRPPPKSGEQQHPSQVTRRSYLSLPQQPVASTHMCTHLMAAIREPHLGSRPTSDDLMTAGKTGRPITHQSLRDHTKDEHCPPSLH